MPKQKGIKIVDGGYRAKFEKWVSVDIYPNPQLAARAHDLIALSVYPTSEALPLNFPSWIYTEQEISRIEYAESMRGGSERFENKSDQDEQANALADWQVFDVLIRPLYVQQQKVQHQQAVKHYQQNRPTDPRTERSLYYLNSNNRVVSQSSLPISLF